ncbi:hypothetical protein D910_02977 [Dendroctonus ponderosae]|uniref:Uncharacterized protein n=1 Tax=Dendroctonus ponderosae TaxID=77166 RepID=U4TZT9_DENPD|nr:hypothetical protein D910_02977 [Dendroctonus ponderosae]
MLSLPDVVRIDQNVAPCAPASAQPGSSDEEPEPSDVQPGPSDTHHENNDKNDRLANAIRAILSDLSDPADGIDEGDILVSDPHLIRRRKQGRSPHRSSSASSASVYFAEVNVGLGREPITEVRSTEDISSGYSSAEGLYAAQHPLRLQSRESIGSNRANSLTRSRSTRVTRSSVPKKANITSDEQSSATLPRIKKSTKKRAL